MHMMPSQSLGGRNLFRFTARVLIARRSGINSAFLLAALLIEVTALAQPFSPHIGYVYPAGGRQGTTFQITVGGQYLGAATNIDVSGDGVRGVFAEYNRPMSQKEFNDLREEIRVLQERKRDGQRASQAATNRWTAADERKLAEIREKILKNPPNRQGNPAIAETATIKITVATNAEPGERELRLGAPNGLSNPLVFCVGHLPEFAGPPEKSPNPDVDRFRERFGRPTQKAPGKSETRVSLPLVLNGQIMPGAVDRYRFSARKGQRLVMAASARALIPYLADAVPGWFQATLALYDAKGQELAYDDDYRFNPDPVLACEIPADGDYVLEIKDAIYRGREDFVYRITVGELPFVTSIFPLGGPAGGRTSIGLKGWNLPEPSLKEVGGDASSGIQFLCLRKGDRLSNRVPYAIDSLPELVEQEPNNERASAQPVSLPLIVNGRVNQPGDADVFRFDGRAGEEIVAEIFARRLNSPVDSALKLTDASGKQLAFNDDFEDKGAGLTTHHADSYLRFLLPANGTYYLHLTDTQRQGGPEYPYRLRVSPPHPDFELRVIPSSINVRAGAAVVLTIHALRKDGCTNEIMLKLKDAPPGFTLNGARVPANQDQVRFTLTVPASLDREILTLALEGRATVRGQEIVRPVVPADDMMQAFAYRHLVPAKELKLAVTGRGFGRGPVRVLGSAPVRIPAGGTARVQLDAPARAVEQFNLQLSEPPEGITIQTVTPSRSGTEIVLQCDAAKVKPGLQGNLIVTASAARGQPTGKAKTPGGLRGAPVATMPAIPFEIVPR